jgi:hypothetical protein
MWRLLGIKRVGETLFIAVEWLRAADDRYALVELSLARIALHWRAFPSGAAACSALSALDAEYTPAVGA